jgi:hypothetical protein
MDELVSAALSALDYHAPLLDCLSLDNVEYGATDGIDEEVMGRWKKRREGVKGMGARDEV